MSIILPIAAGLLINQLNIIALKFSIYVLVFYLWYGWKISGLLRARFPNFTLVQKPHLGFQEKKISTNPILVFGISVTVGTILNFVIGILNLLFIKSPSPLLYYIELLIIGILLEIFIHYERLKQAPNPTINFENGKVIQNQFKSIILFTLILLPTFYLIGLNFNQMPFPYLKAWDFFFYLGKANSIFLKEIDVVNLFSAGRWGFPVLLANIMVACGIGPYNMPEIYKLGIFLTLGIASLWIYLLTAELSTSKIIGLVMVYYFAFFDGKIALGGRYFLPSALTWQLCFGIFSLILIFLRNHHKKMGFKFHLKWLILTIIIIIGTITLYIFHNFITLAFIAIILVLLLLKTKLMRSHQFYSWILLGVAGIAALISNFINTRYITQFFALIFKSEMIFWDFDQKMAFLQKIDVMIILILAILVAFYIQWKKIENYQQVSTLFGVLILFYISNSPFTYRTIYFIYFLALLNLSALFPIITQCYDTFTLTNWTVIREKVLFFRIFRRIRLWKPDLTVSIKGIGKRLRKNTKESKTLLLLAVISITIYPWANLLQSTTIYGYNKIYDDSADAIYASSYTLEEYNAAVWIHNNIDLSTSIAIEDPGTHYILYGIAGLQYWGYDYETIMNPFLEIFQQCNSFGLNITKLESLILLQKTPSEMTEISWYLVMNPRMHMWIQTGDPAMYELGYSRYINHTLNEYISQTSNILQVYNNSEINIYRIFFN